MGTRVDIISVARRSWLRVWETPRDVTYIVRATWNLRQSRWWRSWPPIPRPGKAYMNFRRQTVLGDIEGSLTYRDIVDFARWSVAQRAVR